MKLVEIKVGMEFFTSRIVSSKPVVQGENLVTRIQAEFPAEYADWTHFVEFRSGTQHVLLPLDVNDCVDVPQEFSAINFPKLEVQFQCRNKQQVAVDQKVLYVDVLKGTNVVNDFTAPEDELNLMMDHLANYNNPHEVIAEQVKIAGICNLTAQNVQEALQELKKLIDLGGGQAPTDIIQRLDQHDTDIAWCKEAINNLKVDIANQNVALTDKITKVQDQLGSLKETLLKVQDSIRSDMQTMQSTLSGQISDMKTDFEHHFQTTDEEVDKNYSEFLTHQSAAQQKFDAYDAAIAELQKEITGGGASDIEALQKELDALEETVNGVQKNVDAVSDRVEALETDNIINKNAITDLKSKADLQAADITDLKNKAGAASTAIGSLQTDVAQAQTDITALQKSIGQTPDIEGRLSKAEENIRTNTENIEAVRTLAQGAQDNVTSLAQTVDTRLDSQDKLIADQTAKVGGLEQRVGSAETNISSMNSTIQSQAGLINGLDGRVQTLETENAEQNRRLDELEAGGSGVGAEIEALEQKVDTHIAGASQEFGRLDSEIKQLQNDRDLQAEDIREIRHRDDMQDLSIGTNTYNIEQLRDRVVKVEKDVAGISSDISQVVEEIAGPIIEQKVDEAVSSSLSEYVTKTELTNEVTKVVNEQITNLVESGDVVTKDEVTNIVNQAVSDAITEATKDFVTDSEMQEAISAALEGVTVDAYTKAEADERFALKSEIPDLSNYALKSEIPDVSGLATKEELTELQKTVEGQVIELGDSVSGMQATISGIEENITQITSDVENVYTKQEIDEKNFATTGESGTVYTKTEVDQKIEDVAVSAVVNWGEPLTAP